MRSEREAFERAFPVPAHWIEFDEERNRYYCPYCADAMANSYQGKWEAWQASANREGYKLVPVKATKHQIDKAIYDLNLSGGVDILVDIYQTMIESVNNEIDG